MKKKDLESFGKKVNKEGGWEAFYARKKGKGHILNQKPCQDYCLVEELSNNSLITVVADGHGGEEYSKSDIGSKLACNVLFNTIKDYMNAEPFKSSEIKLARFMETRGFIRVFLEKWKEEVIKDYGFSLDLSPEEKNRVMRKYGTTLLFALILKSTIVLGQIGDGAILLFDDCDRNQLFKRHDIKRDSLTNSLVSSKAEDTFVIRTMDRRFFEHLLLSTDGIYDKLDNSNSFLLYGKNLVSKTRRENNINEPFCVEDLDISSYTKDDCTTVLINLLNHNKAEISASDELIPYENVKFERACGNVEIYSAISGGKRYEIHLLPRSIDEIEDYPDQSHIMIKRSVEHFGISGSRIAYVYPIKKEKLRLSVAVEYGYHSEKKYANPEIKDEYQSNELWLKVYESLIELDKKLKKQNIKISRHYQECFFIDTNGEIEIFADAFLTYDSDIYAADLIDFLHSFGILGKLKYLDKEWPIFKTKNQGQILYEKQEPDGKKPFCCSAYNFDKNIFGLVNLSDSAWCVLGTEGKMIKPKGVLRLTNNCDFIKKDSEGTIKENINSSYEEVIYSIKVFDKEIII